MQGHGWLGPRARPPSTFGAKVLDTHSPWTCSRHEVITPTQTAETTATRAIVRTRSPGWHATRRWIPQIPTVPASSGRVATSASIAVPRQRLVCRFWPRVRSNVQTVPQHGVRGDQTHFHRSQAPEREGKVSQRQHGCGGAERPEQIGFESNDDVRADPDEPCLLLDAVVENGKVRGRTLHGQTGSRESGCAE